MTGVESRKAVRALLASSLRGRGRLLWGLVGWSMLAALPTFLSGRLIAQATDDGFLARRPLVGFAWLGVFAVSVVAGALGTREAYCRLSAVVEPFRDQLLTQTVDVSLRRSTRLGALSDTAGVARITQHVEIAREAWANVLMVSQGFVVGAVSALLGLATLAPSALVLVLPPLVVGLAIFLVLLVRMASTQRDSILANERIAEEATAMAEGLRDVVACGAERLASTSVGIHIDEQARATMVLARLSAVRALAIGVGGLLPLILILVNGPWLLRQGVSTGALLGSLTYVLYGVQPALQTLVREMGNTGLWLLVACRRILEANHLDSDGEARVVRRGSHLASDGVRLAGVTFRYGPWAEPVVRELDLTIATGDHLAVVGPSGVGKSTLAGLIAGLLQPEAGEIRVDGMAVAQMDRAELARWRVLIPQQAYVFEGTVGENLTYLRPEAAEDEIDHAVDELGARSLIARLGGYDADLDVSALSSGERQLITLVRAYLSPAPLVILDEASCHLDPAAESVVEQAFARRPGTLVVIAHRITSALRAQRVLVMDGAEILVGTREDLTAQSALYRDLVGHWV